MCRLRMGRPPTGSHIPAQGKEIELVFERQVMVAAVSGSGQSWNGVEEKDSQIAGYWDQKRLVRPYARGSVFA